MEGNTILRRARTMHQSLRENKGGQFLRRALLYQSILENA